MSDHTLIAIVSVALIFIAVSGVLEVILYRQYRKAARDALTINSSLKAEVLLLAEAVETARRAFEHYAALHQAKGTPEGNDKAAKNRRLAEVMALGLEMTGNTGVRR